MNIHTSLADSEVAAHLNTGRIGVLPGDTVYGVMARAADPAAVARVYAAKQRDGKPGTLVAASVDQLVGLGLKRRYITPIAGYWPGAVSVVIPCGSALDYIHQGAGSLAVRIPDDQQLRKLLESTGPLLTSSANLTGQPPAVTIRQAIDYFGDTVDLYVDGGDLSDRLPSTVIRVVDDAIEVLRPGAVKID